MDKHLRQQTNVKIKTSDYNMTC